MKNHKGNRLFLIVAVLMGILVLVGLVVLVVNYRNSRQTAQEVEKESNRTVKSFREVKINGVTLKAELASTPQERRVGLMGRAAMANDEAMLFTFGAPFEYPFWMKNMKVSIDIIWIGENLNVVDLDESIPPCTQDNCELYTPVQPAKYVLETSAGWARQNNVKIGNTVEFGNTTVEIN